MSQRGNPGDDDRFRVRPSKPRQRGDTFIAQVLRQTSKAAGVSGRGARPPASPGSRLGRGHVAARFTGQSLTALSRRATVKVRLVYLQQASGRSTVQHLRYIEREGVDRQGGQGRAYGAITDEADTAAFEERGRATATSSASSSRPRMRSSSKTCAPHPAPDAAHEADLGTRLDWVAVDHGIPTTRTLSCCAARTTLARISSFRVHHPRHARAGDGTGHRMAGAAHRAGDPAHPSPQWNRSGGRAWIAPSSARRWTAW